MGGNECVRIEAPIQKDQNKKHLASFREIRKTKKKYLIKEKKKKKYV